MTTSNMTKLTRRKLKSPRLLLILSTLAIFATSVATIVSLILGGYDFIHYIFPSLMVIADIVFLFLSLFTNYRFRYAIPIPLVYLGVSVALTAVTVLTDGGTGGTDVFTHFAFYSFIVVHLLAVLTVVFAYMHAAGVGKKPSGMRNTTAIAFLLLVASVSVYSYSMLINGWFGQGAIGVERTLEYSYNESDNTYTVSGVLNGRGDTIVVPSEFNGIRVKSVDCSIFDTSMVTKVYLNCDKDTELVNSELLYNESQPRTVYVKEYQHFGEKFLKKAYSEQNSHFIGVVNQMQPSDIEEGKVYVTFTYTYDDLLAVGGNVLPMWVGNKGDVIDADDFASEFDYIAHPYVTENGSENKLWSYNNINKRIFKGVDCFGTAVNESINHATVNFETLYKVTVDEDNDTVYDIPAEFRYANVSVAESDNIFASSEVDAWLATFAPRPGFDYSWKYDRADDSTTDFTTLSEVLYDGITIRPEWTMKAPTITEIKLDNNSLIYGETASFSSSANPAVDNAGFNLSYSWTFGGNVANSAANWEIFKSHPNNTGKYTLSVTASHAGSSLTSTATADIELTVDKRPVDIIWNALENGDYTNLYTALDQTVSWKIDEDDIYVDDRAGDNALALTSTSGTIKDARSYIFDAELSNLTDCYVITEATASKTYSISPAPVTAIWSFNEDGYTYSGYAQAPTATAVGLGADGTLVLTVKGAAKNAGEGHVVTASADDYNNYVVGDNSTAEYDILPYPIDVQWNSETLELVFNGREQKPEASIQGLALEGTIKLDVAGEMLNAGDGYTATASTENANYLLKDTYITTTFKITPMPVKVTWSDLTLAYNGAKQLPTAAATGALGAKVDLIVSCDEDSVEYRDLVYNASVITEDTNYTLSNTVTEFNITKREITISWKNTTFTYNGEGQAPTASIVNAVEGEELELEYTYYDADSNDIGVITPENAANYTIEALLSVGNPVNNNYSIKESSAKQAYTINKLTVEATWPTETSFVYDKTAHIINATVLGVDGETPIAITMSGEQTNVGTYYATVASNDSNYQVKSSTANQKFTITPKEVAVIWGELEFIYNGVIQTPTATADVIDGDNANIVTVSGGKTNANTGGTKYTATAKKSNATGAGNYTLITDTTTAEFEILPYTANVTWNLNVTYNGYAQAPTATVKGPKNETVYINITGDGEFAGSGYSASAALDTTKNTTTYYHTNYVLSGETTAYSISPKSIGLANTNWGTTTFTYDGKMQAPTASFAGVGDDGTIQLYIDGAQENSGQYTATASLVDGAYAGSYTFSGITSKGFAINKAPITVTWADEYFENFNSQSSFVYDANQHVPTATFKDVNDVSQSLNVTVYKGSSNVGYAENVAKNYKVSVSLAGTEFNANYTLTSYEKSFSITEKPIDIIWSDDKFTYDGNNHAPTAVIKSGDVLGSDEVILSAVAGGQTNAATYTASVSISGADADNYKISNDSCTFVIKRAEIKDITWSIANNSSFAFDNQDHAVIATFKDINGDDKELKVTLKRNNTSVSGQNAKNAGDYVATATLYDSDTENYILVDANSTISFTITKVKVKVNWSNTEVKYNGTRQKPTATADSIVINGATINFSLTVKVDNNTNGVTAVGSYTATATFANSTYNANYELVNATTNFVIVSNTENN